MSNRRGLPTTTRMRHDSHFVEELAANQTNAIGQMLSIDQLRPNPAQPRSIFDGLEELVASIQRVGVLEPLLVRRSETGYEIISGERRFRASRAAELTEVPCIVMDIDDQRALEVALIENLQRQDLSPFEESEGLQALIDQYGFTHEEVAERVSKSRTSVTESLRLTIVPAAVRALLQEGGVRSKSVILELCKTDGEEAMLALAQRVVDEGLTRNDLRNLRRGVAPEVADVIEIEEASDAEPEAAEPTRTAPVPPRRVTYRSKAGITVTVYLNADEVSLADVERSLLEAIRELRSNGLPEVD
ncbi:MAG: ParB/RepB/Spo0J family partition protein [Acidobacteria bacterium]|nr:ParB/RepB/Spo0J family partition protein [Acidobacteriota bacterium]